MALTAAQIDREQWDLEYQQVAPRLQIRLAAEARDWRTHLETAADHLRRTFPSSEKEAAHSSSHDTIAAVWPVTKKHLHRVRQEVSEHLDKIDSREEFLNNELAARTDEFRNKKQIHKRKQVCFPRHVSFGGTLASFWLGKTRHVPF